MLDLSFTEISGYTVILKQCDRSNIVLCCKIITNECIHMSVFDLCRCTMRVGKSVKGPDAVPVW